MRTAHRYIVESLQAGMNKRKTASVYTPALATPQVKSSRVIPNSGEEINNWYKSAKDFTIAAAGWPRTGEEF